MQFIHSCSTNAIIRSKRFWLLTFVATGSLLAGVAGCGESADKSTAEPASSGGKTPRLSVVVVKPERATLRRSVRQPGRIQAFEHTPIYSKLAGYVLKWHVDIGDPVQKGDLLAELWVPEMVVDVKQKKALVQQADAEIKQAKDTAAAAQAGLKSADAKVTEAEAGRLRAKAEHKRTKSQYERLARVGNSGVIDKEAVEETRYAFEAAEAGLAQTEAKVKSAQALRDESQAKFYKAKADVIVAEAHWAVAKENRAQAQALLAYAKLTAPYKGVVTRRNVNTGDFVQPATGTKAEALYVVERRDWVRIFVDVPEGAAGWVNKGAKARIRVQVLKGREFTGAVARTSYSLDPMARTLVAEIDLPNPKDELRPGMYAFATITAELPNVMTLPTSAVLTQGDITQGFETCCFLVVDGKAQRTPIEVGAVGGDRVEVLKKQAKPAKSGAEGVWESFTGQEAVVGGNLSALSDGQAVSVAAKGS